MAELQGGRHAALGAKATQLSWLRFCLSLLTWWSVILLPGMPPTFDVSRRLNGSPATRTHPEQAPNRPAQLSSTGQGDGPQTPPITFQNQPPGGI